MYLFLHSELSEYILRGQWKIFNWTLSVHVSPYCEVIIVYLWKWCKDEELNPPLLTCFLHYTCTGCFAAKSLRRDTPGQKLADWQSWLANEIWTTIVFEHWYPRKPICPGPISWKWSETAAKTEYWNGTPLKLAKCKEPGSFHILDITWPCWPV